MRALGLILATAIVAGCTASTAGEPTNLARTQLDASMIAHVTGAGSVRPTVSATPLRTYAEVEAYAGQFVVANPGIAKELAAQLADVDLDPERTLYAAVLGSSCRPPSGARLWLEDNEIDVEPTGPTPPKNLNCYVPYTSVGVFQLRTSDLPRSFLRQPEFVGPGHVVAHEQLSYDVTDATAAEITEPGAFADFLAAIPDAPRVRLPAAQAKERTYAFVELGCKEDTAELIITADRVEATLDTTEPDMVIACDRAVPYLVVMRVAAEFVPEHAVAG